MFSWCNSGVRDYPRERMKQNTQGNRFRLRFHQTKRNFQKRPESMLLVGIPSKRDLPTPNLPQLLGQLRSTECTLEVLWVLGLESFLHRGGYPNAINGMLCHGRVESLGSAIHANRARDIGKSGGTRGSMPRTHRPKCTAFQES